MVDVSHIGFGGQEGPILKQESFFVCHVMISMEGENHFSWIMLKFKKKRQIWFFQLIRHPGYCIFCFFKMADSFCPSWIAKFKLPPN